ncbi:MAG: type II CAAX endopeptidase family protein [Ghiorsea sp.]
MHSQPFLMLPTRFLLFGLLGYIILELLASFLLQNVFFFQDENQIIMIALRLLELLGFIGLVHHYRMVESIGLKLPTKAQWYVFIQVAAVCVLLVSVLYMINASWFQYVMMPAWLHGFSGLFLMVVLAPIVEEIIFRGLLYRMLREQWGIAISVLVSAVFFSLVHHGMIISPQLAGGVIFALAYEWSKSLWVSIALHMGANGAVYILSVLALAT